MMWETAYSRSVFGRHAHGCLKHRLSYLCCVVLYESHWPPWEEESDRESIDGDVVLAVKFLSKACGRKCGHPFTFFRYNSTTLPKLLVLIGEPFIHASQFLGKNNNLFFHYLLLSAQPLSALDACQVFALGNGYAGALVGIGRKTSSFN